MGKGGARHTSKPVVDVDLLVTCLADRKDLLADLGPYEQISRNQCCNPKALLKVLPLVKGLVALEPTAEIHPGNLRQAVMQVLMEHPALNKSNWNGGLWVNVRVERVGVVLYHMRRLKQGEDLRMCAGKLTSLEFMHLQEVIDIMEKKDNEMHALPLAKREEEEQKQPEKKLKKEISEVSLDSQGYPACFVTPPAGENEHPLPKGSALEDSLAKGGEDSLAKALPQPSFLRRRQGQLATTQEPKEDQAEEKAKLQKSLGFVAKRPACKPLAKGKSKPLAKGKSKPLAKGKSKPLAKGKKKGTAPSGPPTYPRKKWTKLRTTKTNKEPWRAYICGTTAEDGKGKVSLIVETTHKNHTKYLEILEHIQKRLWKKTTLLRMRHWS